MNDFYTMFMFFDGGEAIVFFDRPNAQSQMDAFNATYNARTCCLQFATNLNFTTYDIIWTSTGPKYLQIRVDSTSTTM